MSWFMHYYFSSWWGVHVIKFVLVHTLLLQFMVRCTCVHALLLQFMVRCTCDKVCPGSCITTSVHGEVYMCNVCHGSSHYYFSSWWRCTCVHALLLQFMVRCTCVHALLLQFMVRCTCVHALLLQFMVK